MEELHITEKHIAIFKQIIETYKEQTQFSTDDYWRNLSDNELWLWLLGQVMVVGSAAGNDRFQKREDLKQKMDYTALSTIKNDKELQQAIHEVLREAGVRYASKEMEKCSKSKALAHNYRFVSCFEGGFKGLLQYLSTFNGNNAEVDRVSYLMKHLKFIKNKSARDFLMSMGMNKNTLALDIRIQNIFKHIRIHFPSAAALSKAAVYDATEYEIVEKICKPLQITPAQFDRILYQNYSAIMRQQYN